jgi:hypothetical protein
VVHSLLAQRIETFQCVASRLPRQIVVYVEGQNVAVTFEVPVQHLDRRLMHVASFKMDSQTVTVKFQPVPSRERREEFGVGLRGLVSRRHLLV